MANISNEINQKSAILLSKDIVSVQEWKNYLQDNWDSLTKSLTNCTILILGGRHGKDDGKIGEWQDGLKEHFNMLVSFLTLL